MYGGSIALWNESVCFRARDRAMTKATRMQSKMAEGKLAASLPPSARHCILQPMIILIYSQPYCPVRSSEVVPGDIDTASQ